MPAAKMRGLIVEADERTRGRRCSHRHRDDHKAVATGAWPVGAATAIDAAVVDAGRHGIGLGQLLRHDQVRNLGGRILCGRSRLRGSRSTVMRVRVTGVGVRDLRRARKRGENRHRSQQPPKLQPPDHDSL